MTAVTIEEPTPAGGSRSEALYTAQDGTPVDKGDERAFAVEIIEYDDDGTVLARHYGPLRGPGGVLPDDPGDVDEQEDQAKGTWDLWWVDGHRQYQPVETLDQLLRSLGWDTMPTATQRELVAPMLTNVVWEAAPDGLRREVSAWLTHTRPADATPEPPPEDPGPAVQIDPAELEAAEELRDSVDDGD